MNETESGPPALGARAPNGFFPSVVSRWWALAICGLTFFAYLPSLRFQFVHDDRGIIVENPAIRTWSAVPGYFATAVWQGVARSYLANSYRPLYLLWFRVNDAMFGGRAAGWHLTSVLVHVAATYCVFLLACRIFRDTPIALLSGLIFGLHPVHIEVAVWISAVDDCLVVASTIPAYLCWVRYREVAGRKWLAASLLLYSVGLLSKEMAIVLPMLVFASEWYGFPQAADRERQTFVKRLLLSLKSSVPFIGVTLLYLVVRIVVLKGFSHPTAHVGWLTVLLTWPSLLLFYAKLLLWPVGLGPFYPLEYILQPTMWNTLLPVLLLAPIAAVLRKWSSHSRSIAQAVSWLIVPILPVLNIQVFGDQNFAHNRYLYLPSVGFALLAAATISKIRFRNVLPAGLISSQLCIGLGLALVMGLAIQLEDGFYANDLTFYAQVYSNGWNHDPVIGMDYANALAERGDFPRATAVYQNVIRENPTLWGAYFNFGYMCYQRGQADAAAQYLSQAVAGDPGNAEAFFYLGLSDLKLSRIDQAEANLRQAIGLAPAAANYHFALGVVLKVKGDLSEALGEFQREVILNPPAPAAAQQGSEVQRLMAGR